MNAHGLLAKSCHGVIINPRPPLPSRIYECGSLEIAHGPLMKLPLCLYRKCPWAFVRVLLTLKPGDLVTALATLNLEHFIRQKKEMSCDPA